MRDRPTFALRPLSLALTTLFRGSSALHNSARFAPATPRFFDVSSFSSLPSPLAARAEPHTKDEPHDSHDSAAVVGQGAGRARRWVIPWGNKAEVKDKAKAKTELTRILKILPDAPADLKDSDCFRVMSFNMLAQPLASSKMFPYVPKNQLKKNKRGPRVRAEVCRYGADVICLQECDSFDEILASLQEDKANQGSVFKGVYKPRDSGEMSHGVAILYDSKRFRLLDSGSCDFGKYLFSGVGAFALLQDRRRRPPRTRPCDGETVEDDGDSSGPIRTTQPSADDGADSLGGHGDESNATAGGGEGEGGVGRTGRRTGGALGSGAEASESGIVCVATGHLYWHPDGGAIRLAQAEILMANVSTFLEERFGESYGSVPVVLAGDLNNVPGVDVYRLLSGGAYEGGTPEAFHRRKRERARARKEEKVEKARQAIAKVAEVRARNAAAIAAARTRSSDSVSVGGEDRTSAAATAAEGAPPSASDPAVASGAGKAAAAAAAAAAATEAGGGDSVEAVAGAGWQEEGGAAAGATSLVTGGGAAPAGSSSRVAATAVAVAAAATAVPASVVDCSPGDPDAHSRLSSESSPSGVDLEAPRDASEGAVNRPDGDRDEDMRRYEQGFRGLSSAYGAYSSVFSSQLSKRRPSGESSVCEVTGQHTIGHVHLGARQGGVNGGGGGGSAQEMSGGAPDISWQQPEDEEDEAVRPMGEPQLTTCTDSFAGTIDYIWHTPQLQVRSLLGLPSLKQAMQGGGLPTASYPSDHVSIMAELHWQHPAGDDPDAPTRQ